MDPAASRGKNLEYYVVDLNTDSGKLLIEFNSLDRSQRNRILGYVEAFSAMMEDSNRKKENKDEKKKG